MFIRKKKNTSGSVSIQIISKTKGYKVVKTIGCSGNKEKIKCVVAIGDPKIKKLVVDKLEPKMIKYANAIHPSVIMSEYVELGKDVIICAGTILTVNIKIGNHVNININSTVGHDSVIEDYCSIMPTATINGNNHLSEGVYVGTGSTFIHQVSIGRWTTIGAGTVVFRDVPENVVAIGVPAKVVKRLE